jgi:hypothetical protein
MKFFKPVPKAVPATPRTDQMVSLVTPPVAAVVVSRVLKCPGILTGMERFKERIYLFSYYGLHEGHEFFKSIVYFERDEEQATARARICEGTTTESGNGIPRSCPHCASASFASNAMFPEKFRRMDKVKIILGLSALP